MNGNDVQRIPSRMCKYFPKLRELKIDENRLSEISDRGFEDCGEITILTMRKNKLTEIKSNAVSKKSTHFLKAFQCPTRRCYRWFGLTQLPHMYHMGLDIRS